MTISEMVYDAIEKAETLRRKVENAEIEIFQEEEREDAIEDIKNVEFKLWDIYDNEKETSRGAIEVLLDDAENAVEHFEFVTR